MIYTKCKFVCCVGDGEAARVHSRRVTKEGKKAKRQKKKKKSSDTYIRYIHESYHVTSRMITGHDIVLVTVRHVHFRRAKKRKKTNANTTNDKGKIVACSCGWDTTPGVSFQAVSAQERPLSWMIKPWRHHNSLSGTRASASQHHMLGA